MVLVLLYAIDNCHNSNLKFASSFFGSFLVISLANIKISITNVVWRLARKGLVIGRYIVRVFSRFKGYNI